MRRGRHRGGGRGLARATVLLAIIGLLLLLLTGGAFAGYRYERAQADRILPGVSIAGVDVSGMTRAQALRALARPVAQILDRPIEIRSGGRTWELTARSLGTSVDASSAVDSAMGLANGYGWTTRLYHRLLDRPLVASFDLPVSYDDTPVRNFVKQAAVEVKRAPRDAFLDVVEGKVVRQHSQPGRALRNGSSREALAGAVRDGGASVRLSTRTVQPGVAEDSLGQTIIIRVSENTLYLYEGLTLEKTYRVATGQLDRYPTPLGHFHVINKRINPTWYNPAKDTWGADEPDFIPPGPDNPLGTRALDLDAPGIRIHGTPADSSIGSWASHGCIRMHIPESEALFGLVDVGTPVIIAW